jgi:hypothetical protein
MEFPFNRRPRLMTPSWLFAAVESIMNLKPCRVVWNFFAADELAVILAPTVSAMALAQVSKAHSWRF